MSKSLGVQKSIGCTEPIGIGAQEIKLLCNDPVVGRCPKCDFELCEWHLEIHKNRHKVLDNQSSTFKLSKKKALQEESPPEKPKTAREQEAEASERDMA